MQRVQATLFPAADPLASRLARCVQERAACGGEELAGDGGATLARAPAPAPAAPFMLQRYSGSDAATYAKKWAKSTNPDYPRFSNDCTNFVSQSLLAGGWSMDGGSCDDRTSNSAWWYGDWTCWYPNVRASRTWSAAQNLANYMSASGRGTAAAHVLDLEVGDVLQMEFTGPDAYNPGRIGHAMVVTGKRGGDLFLSYHTSDHLDEPFFAPGGILSRYPTAKYYGWKL